MQQLASILGFIFLGLPLIAYVANVLFSKRIHGVTLYFLVAFLGYLTIVGSAWAADIYHTRRMESFEGVNTPEADQAREDWASDTGRTMAPFIGVPASLVWVGINFAILYLGEWILRKLFTKPTESPFATAAQVDDQPAVEDGNPYRPPPSP